MAVVDYYPVFHTSDIESEIKHFTDDLGFTVVHRPEIEFLDYAVLENVHKRRVDLVCSHFPADSFPEGFLGMRANVSDFAEGLSCFESQGYSLLGEAHETAASITALLIREDGSRVVLFHHKK